MTPSEKKALVHLGDGRTAILDITTTGCEWQEKMTIEGGGGILPEKRIYEFHLRHLGGVYPISAEYDEVLAPPRPPTAKWPRRRLDA